MSVLAIDAGTTGVTVLVVGEDGTVQARGYQEFSQHFPQPGWVEHEPEEIWQAVIAAARVALKDGHEISCIGVTVQRETAVLWDRATLQAPRRAIVWQDRRTTGVCARLAEHGPRIAELTGLRLGDARGHRPRGARRRRRHRRRGRPGDPPPASRRGRGRQRPAVPAAGRPPGGSRTPSDGARDHRARRGHAGRARHRAVEGRRRRRVEPGPRVHPAGVREDGTHARWAHAV